MKKPKSLGIKELNPKKAILQGTGNLKLVRPVEYKEVVIDNRSLYFKDDFIKEKEKDKKWLLS